MIFNIMETSTWTQMFTVLNKMTESFLITNWTNMICWRMNSDSTFTQVFTTNDRMCIANFVAKFALMIFSGVINTTRTFRDIVSRWNGIHSLRQIFDHYIQS